MRLNEGEKVLKQLGKGEGGDQELGVEKMVTNQRSQNSPLQSAHAEAFAEAYLCFLVSASAKRMPRELNA